MYHGPPIAPLLQPSPAVPRPLGTVLALDATTATWSTSKSLSNVIVTVHKFSNGMLTNYSVVPNHILYSQWHVAPVSCTLRVWPFLRLYSPVEVYAACLPSHF